MKVLWVKVTAPFASFRRPLDHNYQRTLPLPPPTTLLGVAGAALGMDERELWSKDSPLRGLRVAVLALRKPGLARDMWTVMKIKSNKFSERSPYFREMLFNSQFMLLYGADNHNDLSILCRAFQDPVYTLSLGREDELITVEDLGMADILAGGSCFNGTVIPGDISKLKFKWVPRPEIKFNPPIVENVPMAFQVDKKGLRNPIKKQTFTFLPYDLEIEIKEGIETYAIGILPWRNFTWMN